jgi:hypothetical protein
MASTPQLSFSFQETGATLLFEPAARVTYLWGENVPLKSYDLPFWYLMWGEKWSWQQLDAMAKRYGVTVSRSSDRHVRWWLGYHRRVPLMPFLAANRRFFARLGLRPIGHLIEKLIERAEVVVSYLLTEKARRTPAGRGTACPPSFDSKPM